MANKYTDFRGQYAAIQEIIKMNKWGRGFAGVNFVYDLFLDNFLLVKSLGKRSINLVDFCCGSGEDLYCLSKIFNIFSENNKNFYGIDMSEDMINICIDKYGVDHFKWIIGDSIPSSPKVDLVYQLASFYLTDSQEKTVNSVYESLNIGGLYIFDFYNKKAFHNVDKSRTEDLETLEHDGKSVDRIRCQQLEDNYIIADYHYFLPSGDTFHVEHRDRLDSAEDIERYLSKFEIIDWFSNYTKNKADFSKDKYVVVVARK